MEEKRCIVTPAAVKPLGELFDRWYKCRLQYHTLIRTKSGCCVVLSVFYVMCSAPKFNKLTPKPVVTGLSLLLLFTHSDFTLELCEAAVCFLDDVDRAACPFFKYSIFPLETVMCPSRQIAFSTNFDKREDRYYWNDPPPMIPPIQDAPGSRTCLWRASVLHLGAVSHRAGTIKVHSSHAQTREIGRVQMVIVKNWSVLGLYGCEEEKEKRAGEIPLDRRRNPLGGTIRLRCGKRESDEKEWIPVRAKSDNHYLFWQDAVTPSGPASVATVPQGQEHTTSRKGPILPDEFFEGWDLTAGPGVKLNFGQQRNLCLELTRFTSEQVFNATEAQRLSRAPIYRLRRLFDVVVNRASNGNQHRNRRHQSPLIVISMSNLTSLETIRCECNACDGPLSAPSCFIGCNHGVLIL
ncbi:hypothetical protein NEUTE2DRAFT_131798 [Neurospora tetrasperma FGSC 2509]|nr:hypothetical protein NEUTE2DRAFT_131798 [Neurospora tetrasperma FGSC 2509]